MQHIKDATLLDLTHEIEPYNLNQAAYVLLSSYRHFPKGTIHILLFDIFGEKNKRMVLAKHEDHFFIAPDNGLLAMAFESDLEVATCYEEPGHPSLHRWIHEAGKVSAMLAEADGWRGYENKLTRLHVAHNSLKPVEFEDVLECQVLHIDRFRNVILNISRVQFEGHRRGRKFRIRFMRNEEIREISYHYSDVAKGEKLCRFNSAGFLEIAVNRGPAASLFDLRIQWGVQLLYNTVKIYFE
jgi:S-adenosylmethionine hydrolase